MKSRRAKRSKKPDEYVLFKFKMEYAEKTEENSWLFEMMADPDKECPEKLGECNEYEVEILRISHGVYDKRGEFCEDYAAFASDYDDSLVKGSFESLEEAELKLTIVGWKLEDATEKYKKPGGNEYIGRSVVKAYKLFKM